MLTLPAGSVDVVVTSPPYNLDIKYGTYKDDLPRDSYLKWLDDVFAGVKHCLKDNGHFFLNVGYSNIDPWVGMDVGNVARKHFVLQNNFTWVKSIYVDGKTSGHFKPINSKRFSNPTWEHLFHFTKNGAVECDKLAIGVPYEWDCNIDNSGRMRGRLVKKMGFDNFKHFEKTATPEQVNELQVTLAEKLANTPERPTTRDRGNTWYIPYDTIATRDKRGKHPATFPVALVEQCIQFTGIEDGVLLDPFMGSGTSAIASINQQFDYIGYDIDADYIEFATHRINAQVKDINQPKYQLFDIGC